MTGASSSLELFILTDISEPDDNERFPLGHEREKYEPRLEEVIKLRKEKEQIIQERFQKNQHIALFVNFEIGCWDYLRKDFAFEEENEKM